MVDEYQAVWSEKILDEWLCSSSKQGYISQESAKIEIMQVNLRFPNSMQPLKNFETEEYWLPDFNDIHVLALAIQTASEGLITFNKKDFPRSEVYRYDLQILDPDEFLRNLFKKNRYEIYRVLQPILRRAQESNVEMSMLEIWKKAWLPQFGRLVERL